MNRRDALRTGALFALALPFAARAAASIDEGFDFKRIEPALPVSAGGKPEVLEIFWYGCPHCYHLQAALESWRARRAGDIAYRRVPAVLSDRWAAHARAYYAAETLGVLERTHMALFEAIHAHQRPLADEAALAAFFKDRGVDAGKFRDTFRSFAVDTKLRQAAEIGRRLKLDGVPAVLVAGRYLTSPTMTGGRERTIQVVDQLVDRVGRPVRG